MEKSRYRTQMAQTNKHCLGSRFRLLFSERLGKCEPHAAEASQLRAVRCGGVPNTLRFTTSCWEDDVKSPTIQTFHKQVWSRHSWPARANEGLRVFSPNPRSAGLQRGAHLSARKTTPLSGSCFERRLSVAGYPHSETPSFGERQPLLKKDERYGGGVL